MQKAFKHVFISYSMVSATQLSSYLYCPRKLFISTILMVEEPLKEELVKGRIWHKAYELINNCEERIVKSISSYDYTLILEFYKKEYALMLRNAILMSRHDIKKFGLDMVMIFNNYWPGFFEEAKRRALNVCEFSRKHNILGEQLWIHLTPKILSEQYFKSERLNLSGIIDLIEVHDNNLFVPVELKTGNAPSTGVWDGHRIQLGAYLVLLSDSGRIASEGKIRYKEADERIVMMNSMLSDEVMSLIKKVSALLSGSTIPKHTDNKNKCAKCSFKELCYDEEKMQQLLLEKNNRLS
jgi:CRISPR-associated protein Cas4